MKLIKSKNKKIVSKSIIKKILIISQLKKNNNFSKSQFIYLNEGCLPPSLANDFNKKLIPNYPHLRKKKIYKNYYYLLRVYEYFLTVISNKLNKIHGLNYSKNYWRILIGVWLFEFISIIFDNWNKLKYINKNYNLKYVEIIKVKNSDYIFKDYNDFGYKSITDTFNNSVCNDLFKLLNKKKIKYFVNKNNILNKNIYLENKLNLVINYFKNFCITVFNFFQINKNVFFFDTYLDKKTLFFLNAKFYQLPFCYTQIKIDNKITYNKKKRLQNLKNSKDFFVKTLSNLIFKYMPLSYLENYNFYLNKINKINWPKKPKLIFSVNAFFYNDFFKFWLAEKKEIFKSKFISAQHGGYFFTNRYLFDEKHQNYISDLILTWGYKKKKFKPAFNFKTVNKEIISDNNGKLLIIGYELPRFVYTHSAYLRFSYFIYLKDQLSFFCQLDKKIINKLIFRKYPFHYGWNINLIDLIKKKIKVNVLIDKNKNFYITLKESRLCFVSLNSTTYLETLNLNFPTIIFFNIDNDEINNETKKYLNILKKAEIYFNNYEMAAKKINEIWDNVDLWWYSKSVQNAVRVFCDRFSKRSNKNSVNKLYNLLTK